MFPHTRGWQFFGSMSCWRPFWHRLNHQHWDEKTACFNKKKQLLPTRKVLWIKVLFLKTHWKTSDLFYVFVKDGKLSGCYGWFVLSAVAATHTIDQSLSSALDTGGKFPTFHQHEHTLFHISNIRSLSRALSILTSQASKHFQFHPVECESQWVMPAALV